MFNLRHTFLWVVTTIHIIYFCIFIDLCLFDSIGYFSTRIQEIDELKEMPQTRCRLRTPFTHEIKGERAYVPIEYLGLNKTYELGTLIYPVIKSENDNILQWVLSLPSDFDCRLMLSTPNTVFNRIPSTFSFSLSKDIRILCLVVMVFLTFVAFFGATMLSFDLLDEFKKLDGKRY